MEAVMKSCRKSSVTGVDPIARIVRRAIRAWCALGWGKDYAIEDSAVALGTTTRRVKSVVYGEVWNVRLAEVGRFLDRQTQDIDRKAAEIRKLAHKLESEAKEEWSRYYQLSLALDERPSATSSATGMSGGSLRP